MIKQLSARMPAFLAVGAVGLLLGSMLLAGVSSRAQGTPTPKPASTLQPGDSPVISAVIDKVETAGSFSQGCLPRTDPKAQSCEYPDNPEPAKISAPVNGDIQFKFNADTFVPKAFDVSLPDVKNDKGDEFSVSILDKENVFSLAGVTGIEVGKTYLVRAVASWAGATPDEDYFVEYVFNVTLTDAVTPTATSEATDIATTIATEISTEVATSAATETAVATETATPEATTLATETPSATELATETSTEIATSAAVVTAEVTPEATIVATEAATVEATPEATIEVTPEVAAVVTEVATANSVVTPTEEATTEPTVAATAEVTASVTAVATTEATKEPTVEATVAVTATATEVATEVATAEPTVAVTSEPTTEPTVEATQPAVVDVPVAPATSILTLTIGDQTYSPIAISVDGKTSRVDSPTFRITAVPGDLAPISYAGNKPSVVSVKLFNGDRTTLIGEQVFENQNLVLYTMPKESGNYILSVEVTVDGATTIYFFRVTVN